jgi:hypothetical protein
VIPDPAAILLWWRLLQNTVKFPVFSLHNREFGVQRRVLPPPPKSLLRTLNLLIRLS